MNATNRHKVSLNGNATEGRNAQHKGLQCFEPGSAYELHGHAELRPAAVGHWMPDSPSRGGASCCCDAISFLFLRRGKYKHLVQAIASVPTMMLIIL